MKATLRALSYRDINLKKNYKIRRALLKVTHLNLLRPKYKIWDRKVFLNGHNIPVRIFFPHMKKNLPLMIFFHGGGWVTGNIDTYTKVCQNLSHYTNHIVVSVDYRLAPENPFPCGLEDCYAVTKNIFKHADVLNVHPNNITLIGDSAGGNLAAAVSLMARDKGEFLPKKQILIYPATHNNHTESSPFPSVIENGTDYLLTSKKICDYMDLYATSADDFNNPYFAPLLSKDFSRQPRTLVITAEFDPLRDEGEAYGQKLKSSNNYVEIHRINDALHGFFSSPPSFSQVKQSFDIINSFIKY